MVKMVSKQMSKYLLDLPRFNPRWDKVKHRILILGGMLMLVVPTAYFKYCLKALVPEELKEETKERMQQTEEAKRQKRANRNAPPDHNILATINSLEALVEIFKAADTMDTKGEHSEP